MDSEFKKTIIKMVREPVDSHSIHYIVRSSNFNYRIEYNKPDGFIYRTFSQRIAAKFDSNIITLPFLKPAMKNWLCRIGLIPKEKGGSL